MKLKAAKFPEETPRTVFSTYSRFEMPLVSRTARKSNQERTHREERTRSHSSHKRQDRHDSRDGSAVLDNDLLTHVEWRELVCRAVLALLECLSLLLHVLHDMM